MLFCCWVITKKAAGTPVRVLLAAFCRREGRAMLRGYPCSKRIIFRGARQILSVSCGHERGEMPVRDDHSW